MRLGALAAQDLKQTRLIGTRRSGASSCGRSDEAGGCSRKAQSTVAGRGRQCSRIRSSILARIVSGVNRCYQGLKGLVPPCRIETPMSATTDGSLEKPMARVGVVIPCYGVGTRILEVLARIGPECDKIYMVDDGCPDRPGDLVKSMTVDKRVNVVVHSVNQGVGAAAACNGNATRSDLRRRQRRCRGEPGTPRTTLPAWILAAT